MRQELDATVQRYLVSFWTAALKIVLVVAIRGYFGVETTSFAALVAGAGVAIGTAWSGLLGNFTVGIFLPVLRPYKVGEYVNAGGVEGTVLEIGLFGTCIDTPDNVRLLSVIQKSWAATSRTSPPTLSPGRADGATRRKRRRAQDCGDA